MRSKRKNPPPPSEAEDDFRSLSSLSIDSHDVRSAYTDWVGGESTFSNSQCAPPVPSSAPDFCHRPLGNKMIPSRQPNQDNPEINNEIRPLKTRKPERLSVEEQLRLTQCIHPRERVKGETGLGD